MARRTITPSRMAEHHRDIQGGTARAAVLGVSDGLISNVALILGVAGGSGAGALVRLAGLAGLIGGSVSMAAGEYISMKAQRELFERELAMEARELRRNPHYERQELAGIYEARGVEAGKADELAREMMRDPDIALQTHAREELGIDPTALGAPVRAAISSFVSFAVGAFVPLIPWLFTHGNGAKLATVALGLVAAVAVGTALGRFTGRSRLGTALRQLAFVAVPAAVTFGIGSAVGVGVS